MRLYGKPRWGYILFLIGIASLSIRAVLDSNFATSSLLYVAIPFLLSLALYTFVGRFERSASIWRSLLNHLRDATIIFLATSAFLFEGFLCVLMFMPIYYFFVLIGFGVAALIGRLQKNNQKRVLLLPAVILAMSVEGLSEELSFEREASVTVIRVIPHDLATIKQHMSEDLSFSTDRHWFLSLFPLPEHIEASSLQENAIHKITFVYKRWLFTNFHNGEIWLQLQGVTTDSLRLKTVKNSSYLSHYMNIEGTHLQFREVGEHRTEVTLTINYNRLLDPAWYFAPMQQYAMRLSADYLIENIIDPGTV